MDKVQEGLELRAYYALQGAAGAAGKLGDWRNDVTAALLSDAPLSPDFRQALAQAIMGELPDGFQLELKAPQGRKKKNQDKFGGSLAREEWMKIGQWIGETISSGSPRAESIDLAACEFNASRDKCDKALIYYGRVMTFVERSKESELWKGFEKIGLCPQDAIVSLFNQRDAGGSPLDAT